MVNSSLVNGREFACPWSEEHGHGDLYNAKEMALLLNVVGYGPVESLQLFLSRFALQTAVTELDEELENVWICHKNMQIILKLQKSLSEHYFDEENHESHFSSVNEINCVVKENLQTQFKPVTILNKIFVKLHCCLANYIIRDCLLLYNWGINSFELIVDNEEFYSAVSKYESKICKRKTFIYDFNQFRKWRCLLTKCNKMGKLGVNQKYWKRNTLDLFEEEERKKYVSKRKTPSFEKLVEIYKKCSKPLKELKKMNDNPFQEIFKKDSILYDLRQQQWPKNKALSQKSVDEFLNVILSVKIQQKVDLTGKLKRYSDGWLRFKHILCFFLEKHNMIKKNNGYGRILEHHLKKSGFQQNSRRCIPISNRVICSFIMDILRKVMLFEFFGGNRLRKSFFFEIVRIINGSKNETFIFEPLIQMFIERRNDLVWLREIEDVEMSKIVTLKYLKWLLKEYIFLILKNYFYITDIGSSGYRLYYYRKNDIERAISLWMKLQLKKSVITPVRGELNHWNSVERKWVETGDLELNEGKLKMRMSDATKFIQPVANVRFLPKYPFDGNFRLITNYPIKRTIIGRHDEEKRKLFSSFMDRKVKRVMRLRKVKFLLELLAEKYGSGIKPLPNNPKLEVAWKKAIHLKEIHGKLYFVKADISDAFGSVMPFLLSEIIGEKVRKKGIRTLQLKIIYELRVKNGLIQRVRRKSFSDRPRENSFLISRSTLASSKKKLSSYKAMKLKRILDQIIFNQYLKIKGKIYKVNMGLSQGSAGTFSPLLCDMYYSEMDRIFFRDFLTCSNCVLIRGVDDYLLITSNYEKAQKFYDIVYNGIKDFNVTFSRGKLKTNLKEDLNSVNYLGLIFDVKNMSVKPDYSKYRNKDVLSTMKLCDAFGNNFFKKTRFLQFRSLCTLCLKLHSILLNSTHNNLSVVREIVFGACSMQANRILVLTRHLFCMREKNDLDVCIVLSKSLGKISNAILRVNGEISKEEVIWLFWTAALEVFEKYSGFFSDLLVVIRHRINLVEKSMERNGKELILNFLKKDMRHNESWKELRKTFKAITQKSKPSGILDVEIDRENRT